MTTSVCDEYVDWDPSLMLEVDLADPDDFLKVCETLTRIGIAGRKDEKDTLWQSCHILHKQGRYYIVHFKELFCLDGRASEITPGDLERRNTIAKLLHDWKLAELISVPTDLAPMNLIKVIPFRDKPKWELKTKYKIGIKK